MTVLSQLHHVKKIRQVTKQFSHSRPSQINANIIYLGTGETLNITKDT